jgi:hypothetical protein
MNEKVKRQKFIGNNYALLSKETGVIEGDKLIMKTVPADRFIRIYLEDIGGLLKLTDGEIKILQCIWQICEFNTGKVVLVSSVKKDIEEILEKNGSGIKVRSIGNIISSLTKKNILIPVPERTATYLLNPQYFWKGEELERGKVFRLILEYKKEEVENDRN